MEEEEEEESPIVKEVQGLPGQEATEVKPSETVTDFDELDWIKYRGRCVLVKSELKW